MYFWNFIEKKYRFQFKIKYTYIIKTIIYVQIKLVYILKKYAQNIQKNIYKGNNQ